MQNGTGPALAAPEAGTAWYSVPAAAARLGLKERAVRKRIAAGTLRAERTREGWRVQLPAVPGPAPDRPEAGTGPALQTDELVDQLRGEVAFLRQELREQRERHATEISAWQERLREAHLLAAQRPALPPKTPEPVPGPAPVPARPWWHVLWPWHRGATEA
jgi:excisionase family DNA binding protein